MDNELLANMDLSLQETKLQKEINEKRADYLKEQEAKKLAEKEKQAALEGAAAEPDDIDAKSDDEKPDGIIQPKFKVVHSYPVDIQSSWQGHADALEGHSMKQIHVLPTELTVTIYVKFIDSMKLATLDINENTLMFKYPDVYYLDINLCYKVDKAQGSAKFDKSKKTLTVRVPVIGSTEDSQKVLDKHYKDYLDTIKQK